MSFCFICKMHRLFHKDKISPSTVQKKKKKRGDGGGRGLCGRWIGDSWRDGGKGGWLEADWSSQQYSLTVCFLHRAEERAQGRFWLWFIICFLGLSSSSMEIPCQEDLSAWNNINGREFCCVVYMVCAHEYVRESDKGYLILLEIITDIFLR